MATLLLADPVVPLLVAAAVLLLGAILALKLAPRRGARRSVRRRPGTALPAGRVVYSDAGGGARPLVARGYPLIGKPDYVVLSAYGTRIPVEVKSARAARSPRGEALPRHEDVLQVAVYLIILDDLFRPSPRHGVLCYADASFEIPYTPKLRAEVLGLVAEMQAIDAQTLAHVTRGGGADGSSPRGDPAPAKCRACAFRAICDDATV